ncbi:cell division protein SepF [Vampirovibrio chlorellavorus]|uniref:cell division protein SepF n=1 Tax=Vampirovibrio chlorellavorus TaxID=758823 RepID=UPI0026E9CEDD|nr:cell division protein SepF [Vampirovibrio chlorellavorus]
MNNGLLSKLKNWVSGDPFEDEAYGMEEDYEFRNTRPEQEVEMLDDSKKARKPLRVVDHPTSQKAQVVVIEPRAFEEALEIIEHLRTKKSVILNLHLLDTAQSQRVVDFLSGATHAIDGNQQRIGDGVFIFTPNNVSIRSEAEKNMAIEDAYWKQSY